MTDAAPLPPPTEMAHKTSMIMSGTISPPFLVASACAVPLASSMWARLHRMCAALLPWTWRSLLLNPSWWRMPCTMPHAHQTPAPCHSPSCVPPLRVPAAPLPPVSLAASVGAAAAPRPVSGGAACAQTHSWLPSCEVRRDHRQVSGAGALARRVARFQACERRLLQAEEQQQQIQHLEQGLAKEQGQGQGQECVAPPPLGEPR